MTIFPTLMGALFVLAGCGNVSLPAVAATPAAQMFEVSGELSYRARIALLPGSAAVVQLQDVSLADAPAVVVAEQRVDLKGRQVPIPFRLVLDRAKLQKARRYVVRGTIVGPDDRLLWATTETHLVDQTAQSAEMGLLMMSQASSQPPLRETAGDPASLLVGREWVVEDVNGDGIVDRSKGTLRFNAAGRLSGKSFCNSYSGDYTLTGEDLAIGPLMSTMMACPPALMDLERLFTKILADVTRLEFTPNGALILHTSDGRTITAQR